jgi:hypothetical protein
LKKFLKPGDKPKAEFKVKAKSFKPENIATFTDCRKVDKLK